MRRQSTLMHKSIANACTVMYSCTHVFIYTLCGEQGAFNRISPAMEGLRDEVGKQVAVGRLGEPAELANLASFLLSPYANWITGTHLPHHYHSTHPFHHSPTHSFTIRHVPPLIPSLSDTRTHSFLYFGPVLRVLVVRKLYIFLLFTANNLYT